MVVKITKYNCLCNLGNNIDTVFLKAINGIDDCFELSEDIIKKKKVRIGKINAELPEIEDKKYNLRCNKLILKCLESFNIKHNSDNIAVVVATTNSGVTEYEYSKNVFHSEMGNPAKFIKDYYSLNNFYTTVSTACSSGIKAFSIALDILSSDYAESVIVVGVDSLSPVPIFGFDSLEILSEKPTNPFSKNRCGINIAEGVAAFLVEKTSKTGIEIAGIGETTDIYHATTPDPEGIEATNCINKALEKANIKPQEIDYINLHGTGTNANDLMEGKAINKIFSNQTLASSIKPLTGHCLGASASIEVCLCCKLLDNNSKTVFPHIYDNEYDLNIPKILLAEKNNHLKKLENVLCTSFGFGGTNTAIVLRKGNK